MNKSVAHLVLLFFDLAGAVVPLVHIVALIEVILIGVSPICSLITLA